jgi:hypothetical protein
MFPLESMIGPNTMLNAAALVCDMQLSISKLDVFTLSPVRRVSMRPKVNTDKIHLTSLPIFLLIAQGSVLSFVIFLHNQF